MRATLRVLIVDDQVLVRTGLAMILQSEDGIEVLGEAADGREAIALACSSRPDVVLMDLRSWTASPPPQCWRAPRPSTPPRC